MDFTPERLKTGEHHAIIRSFMVHHQGMVLMSLNNYLFNKRMIRRFHADPRIESIELLLQEQTPCRRAHGASAPAAHGLDTRHLHFRFARAVARLTRCTLHAGTLPLEREVQSVDHSRGLRIQPLG